MPKNYTPATMKAAVAWCSAVLLALTVSPASNTLVFPQLSELDAPFLKLLREEYDSLADTDELLHRQLEPDMVGESNNPRDQYMAPVNLLLYSMVSNSYFDTRAEKIQVVGAVA